MSHLSCVSVLMRDEVRPVRTHHMFAPQIKLLNLRTSRGGELGESREKGHTGCRCSETPVSGEGGSAGLFFIFFCLENILRGTFVFYFYFLCNQRGREKMARLVFLLVCVYFVYQAEGKKSK